MASVRKTTRISIECVDNAGGVHGVIVYEDSTFPTASPQGPAFGAGHGPHSSVRPFQSPRYEDEETAMECDSTGSNGVPPVSFTDDNEVPMEVN